MELECHSSFEINVAHLNCTAHIKVLNEYLSCLLLFLLFPLTYAEFKIEAYAVLIVVEQIQSEARYSCPLLTLAGSVKSSIHNFFFFFIKKKRKKKWKMKKPFKSLFDLMPLQDFHCFHPPWLKTVKAYEAGPKLQ